MNCDREWKLEYTANIIRGMRERAIRQKKEPEPITCPQCYYIRLSGRRCPQCNKMYGDRRRAVLQTNGKLQMMGIGPFKPRKEYHNHDVEYKWRNYYARGLKSRKGLTFNQIVALFAMENNWRYPPAELSLMPKHPLDFYNKVRDVDPSRLIDGKSAESMWQANLNKQKELFDKRERKRNA